MRQPTSPDTSTPTPPGPLFPTVAVFPLRRSPRQGRRVFTAALGAVGAAYLLSTVLFLRAATPFTDEKISTTWLLSALVGLAVGAALFFGSRPPKTLGSARVLPDQVLLPVGDGRYARFSLDQLWVAEDCGVGSKRRFVIAAQGAGFLQIRAADFASPDGPAALAAAVHECLAALPEGAQLLSQVRQRGAWATSFFAARGPITDLCGAVLVAFYALQTVLGAELDPVVLLSLGANSGPLVLQGEVSRLVTANLLHAHPLHLLLNGLGLIFAGRMFESFLGRARYLVLLLGTSITGAAASALAGHWLSIGSSTGIAGLVGAYAWLRWRHSQRFPLPPSRLFWFLLVVTFALPGLVFPNIDHAGHAGGFFGGLLLTAFFLRGDPDNSRRRRSLAALIAATLLSLVFVGAGLTAALRAVAADPDERLPLVASLLANPNVPEIFLNNLAWEVVAHPDASPEQLESALAGAQRAARAEPEAAPIRDTLATALYRAGRFDEAVAMAAVLAEEIDNPFYRGQAARFRWARARRDGPEVPAGFTGPLPRLELLIGQSASARLEIENASPEPVLARAVLHTDDRLLGELTIRIPGSFTGELPFTSSPLSDELRSHLANATAELTLTEVSALPPDDARLSGLRRHFEEVSTEVADLP